LAADEDDDLINDEDLLDDSDKVKAVAVQKGIQILSYF